MTSNSDIKSPISWSKALFNGLIAWLLGLILYLIPGFVVAIPMGFDLGPKLNDTSEIGRIIGQAVSQMYQSNIYLHFGYVFVLAVLILWRSRVISKRHVTKSVTPGLLVAVVPLILTAAPFAVGGHTLIGVLAVVLFLLAGLIGSFKKPTSAPTS